MDRIPENLDVAVLAERIRPLTHQASEGLRHTSESLRQGLDHARDVIAERIDESPNFDLDVPAAVVVAARSLPFLRTRQPVRAGRDPLQWVLLALAVAGTTIVIAVAASLIAQRLTAQRRRVPAPVAVETRSSEPVAIPISRSVGAAQGANAPGDERTLPAELATEGGESADDGVELTPLEERVSEAS